MSYNTFEHSEFTRDRHNNVGAKIRKGLGKQVADIEKQAQIHNVSSNAIALKILDGRKGDMLTYLQQNNINPISDNTATLATQIAAHIAGEANAIRSSFDHDGRESTFEEAFDEYAGLMMREEMQNPHSEFHWSNNPGESFNLAGEGGEQAGEAINKLGNAAGMVPVIGSILGPIMKIGGSIMKGIGHKKAEAARKEIERRRKIEAEMEQQRLMSLQAGAKKKKVLIGAGIVVILLVIIFAAK